MEAVTRNCGSTRFVGNLSQLKEAVDNFIQRHGKDTPVVLTNNLGVVDEFFTMNHALIHKASWQVEHCDDGRQYSTDEYVFVVEIH